MQSHITRKNADKLKNISKHKYFLYQTKKFTDKNTAYDESRFEGEHRKLLLLLVKSILSNFILRKTNIFFKFSLLNLAALFSYVIKWET